MDWYSPLWTANKLVQLSIYYNGSFKGKERRILEAQSALGALLFNIGHNYGTKIHVSPSNLTLKIKEAIAIWYVNAVPRDIGNIRKAFG